eukprot:TRINITY_DN21683_c0_g1_i1.p1 TRINITY_DN21683_c0_g1~~TRINITY_DN21683_c0_g1_i1.p1  ORF type:complete len:329 (-),score=76.84 TRINITY_DN21683_c0_g1_i1:85-1071(-)
MESGPPTRIVAVSPPRYERPSAEGAKKTDYPTVCGIEMRPIVYCRIFVILIFIGLIITLIIEYDIVIDLIEEYLEWIEENDLDGKNWLSVITFIGVELVAIPCFITATLFSLSAGYIFSSVYGDWLGWVVAIGVNFVGVYGSCIISFLLGRYVFRESVESFEARSDLWQAIDIAVKHQGKRIVFLYKLAFVMPGTPFNYLISVSAISFRDFNIGNLGIILSVMVETFIGAQLNSLVEAIQLMDSWYENTTYLIVVIVVCIVAIILMIIVAVHARREVLALLATARASQHAPTYNEAGRDSNSQVEVSLNASSERDVLRQQQGANPNEL